MAHSRWAQFVHRIRSVGKIFAQQSGRVESLESQLSELANFSHRGCGSKERGVVKENKRKRSESEFFEVHFP